jgi:hypothetical protein
VSGYGEELAEPYECKIRVTIISERATALDDPVLVMVCFTAVEVEREILYRHRRWSDRLKFYVPGQGDFQVLTKDSQRRMMCQSF